RTGEDVDLTARVVDIIFARDLVPDRFEQGGERIPHHRATAVTHVHRAGRVGGDIFDVDGDARARLAAAILVGRRVYRLKLFAPGIVRQRHVDEAGASDRDGGDLVDLLKLRGDLFGQRARIGASRLGQHHRGVG